MLWSVRARNWILLGSLSLVFSAGCKPEPIRKAIWRAPATAVPDTPRSDVIPDPPILSIESPASIASESFARVLADQIPVGSVVTLFREADCTNPWGAMAIATGTSQSRLFTGLPLGVHTFYGNVQSAAGLVSTCTPIPTTYTRVEAPELSYDGTTVHEGQKGVAFSVSPTVKNTKVGGDVGTCTVAPDSPSLPSGLTLNPTTCVVSGTPSVPWSSQVPLYIRLTNQIGGFVDAQLFLNIAAEFLITDISHNPVTRGMLITLTGSGFTLVDTVRWGEDFITDYEILSDSSLRLLVPSTANPDVITLKNIPAQEVVSEWIEIADPAVLTLVSNPVLGTAAYFESTNYFRRLQNSGEIAAENLEITVNADEGWSHQLQGSLLPACTTEIEADSECEFRLSFDPNQNLNMIFSESTRLPRGIPLNSNLSISYFNGVMTQQIEAPLTLRIEPIQMSVKQIDLGKVAMSRPRVQKIYFSNTTPVDRYARVTLKNDQDQTLYSAGSSMVYFKPRGLPGQPLHLPACQFDLHETEGGWPNPVPQAIPTSGVLSLKPNETCVLTLETESSLGGGKGGGGGSQLEPGRYEFTIKVNETLQELAELHEDDPSLTALGKVPLELSQLIDLKMELYDDQEDGKKEPECSCDAAATPFGGGSGVPSDPHQICAEHQMIKFLNDVHTQKQASGQAFLLCSSIEATTPWPISGSKGGEEAFFGSFDGRGNTLDLRSGDPNRKSGIFRSLQGALIKDLRIFGGLKDNKGVVGLLSDYITSSYLKNVSVEGEILLEGRPVSGVGFLGGEISNSRLESIHVSGVISLPECLDRTPCQNIGGIAGSLSVSSLLHSSSTVSISLLGSSTRATHLGGVAGKVDKSTLHSVSHLGTLTGHAKVGGIAGQTIDSLITLGQHAGRITASDTTLGGIAGESSNTRFVNTRVESELSGKTSIGGMIGVSSGDSLHSSEFLGSLKSTESSGGFIGEVKTLTSTVVDASIVGTLLGESENHSTYLGVGALGGGLVDSPSISRAPGLVPYHTPNTETPLDTPWAPAATIDSSFRWKTGVLGRGSKGPQVPEANDPSTDQDIATIQPSGTWDLTHHWEYQQHNGDRWPSLRHRYPVIADVLMPADVSEEYFPRQSGKIAVRGKFLSNLYSVILRNQDIGLTGVTVVHDGLVTIDVDPSEFTAQELAQGVKVEIVTEAGSAVSLPGFTPEVIPVPTITDVAPNPVLEGSSLTLTGTDFQEVQSITLGDTNLPYVRNSNTLITATVPLLAPSGEKLTLFARGGNVIEFPTAITVTPLTPTFTSVSTEAVLMGQTVTLTGTNLQTIVSVTWDGCAGTIPFSYLGPTSISIVTPTPACGSGNIRMTDIRGNILISSVSVSTLVTPSIRGELLHTQARINTPTTLDFVVTHAIGSTVTSLNATLPGGSPFTWANGSYPGFVGGDACGSTLSVGQNCRLRLSLNSAVTGNRNLSLNISAVIGGAGGPSYSTTLTGVVRVFAAGFTFTQASTRVSEGNGAPVPVSVEVEIYPSQAEAVTVNYMLLSEQTTATFGDHHNLTHGSVTIPAGQNVATIDFQVTGDVLPNATRKISLYLTNSSSSTLLHGPHRFHDILVEDDDGGQFQFEKLSLGIKHACGITSQSKLYCWGDNRLNIIGDSSAPDWVLHPRAIDSSNSYSQVAVGNEAACGLLTNGTLRCWGRGGSGRLGDGTTQNRPEPITIDGGTSYQAISTGGSSSCGITSAGALKCWGSTLGGSLTPQVVEPGTQFIRVRVGESHACAIRASGLMVCWGLNTNSQVLAGAASTVTTPTLVHPSRTYKRVSTGASHTCAIDSTDQVYCWGFNHDGQLGRASGSENPTDFGFLYSEIESSGNMSCGLRTSGQVRCWGTLVGSSTPTAIDGATTYTSISAGVGDFCGVASSGERKCFGRNETGVWGNGSTEMALRPRMIDYGRTYERISLGLSQFAGILSDQRLVLWGSNLTSSVPTADPLAPTPHFPHLFTSAHLGFWPGPGGPSYAGGWAITTLQKLFLWGAAGSNLFDAENSYIAASGTGHFCAIRTSGELVCSSVVGGTTVMVPLDPGVTYQKLSYGSGYGCGITSTGALRCWGANAGGQLGDGSTTNRSSPVTVDEGELYSEVSVVSTGTNDYAGAGAHTCGITQSGVLKCWGRNQNGQLGDGSTSRRTLPTVIDSGTSYQSVSVAPRHTCGLTTAGLVKCWGFNDRGQLGDGTTTQRNTPVSVLGVSGLEFKALGTGGYGASCAISTQGQLYCWGSLWVGTSGIPLRSVPSSLD